MIRPEATTHGVQRPATCGWPKGWLGLGLAARSSRENGVLASGSVAAGRWQGAAGELTGATSMAPGKALGGGAHPSSGVMERRRRMLGAATFISGEVASVMDDVNGVSLQCWGRREKVRGESIWIERERAVVLIDDGGWWRCSGENQRGGGVSGGGSRRGGCVGSVEGGGAQARARHRMERSEAPMSYPNRRARRESKEGNGGVRLRWPRGRGRKRKRGGWHEVSSQTVGRNGSRRRGRRRTGQGGAA
jgi:hypothetical protein